MPPTRRTSSTEEAAPPARHARDAGLLALTVVLYSASFYSASALAPFTAFVALVPAMAAVEGLGPLRSAVAGALVGASALSIACSWLASYHPVAIALVAFVGAWSFAAAFAAVSAVLRSGHPAAPLAAALLWASADLARSAGFLAFPYGSLPYAFAGNRAALALASVGGAPLVGLAIACVNAYLYAAARTLANHGSRRRAALTALPAAAVVAAAVFGAAPPFAPAPGGPRVVASPDPVGEPAEGSFRVALVQPCIYEQRSAPAYAAAFRKLAALSADAAGRGADLVVWHETAVVPPIAWHLRQRPDRPTYEFVADVDHFLSAYPAPLLLGNGYADPDDPARRVERNSALLYVSGSTAARYDKAKLVPFSEYMPPWFGRAFPSLDRRVIETFGPYWTPGSGARLIGLGDARFASPICFEDSFAGYFASFDEPDFFVVLTNDSWAGSSSMQAQHLAMSRYRAAETGSIVLRAADTGSTAAIAPNGAVVAELAPFEPGVLYADVPLGYSSRTVYEAGGKRFDLAILLLAAVLSALCARRRRPKTLAH